MPAYKKRDRKFTSNHRPISLTCICSCKLLEHNIINSSISTHWEAKNVIREEQHGFQQGKSCESQLIYTINEFANTLKKGKEIDALFLDFSNWKHLIKSLIIDFSTSWLTMHGLCSQLLNWTKDFLIGRSQTVIHEGHSNSSSEVLSGVLQGTILAPLVFILPAT